MKFSTASLFFFSIAASYMTTGISAQQQLRGVQHRALDTCQDDPEYNCLWFQKNPSRCETYAGKDVKLPSSKARSDKCCVCGGGIDAANNGENPDPDTESSGAPYTGAREVGPCNFANDKYGYCQYNNRDYSSNYCRFQQNLYNLDDGSTRQSTGYLKCCSSNYYINGMFYANISCPAHQPNHLDTCEVATGSAITGDTEDLASCPYGNVSCYCSGGKWICK